MTEERRREKKRTGGLREGRGGECSEVAFHAVREMIYKKRVWLREQNQSSVFFWGGGGRCDRWPLPDPGGKARSSCIVSPTIIEQLGHGAFLFIFCGGRRDDKDWFDMVTDRGAPIWPGQIQYLRAREIWLESSNHLLESSGSRNVPPMARRQRLRQSSAAVRARSAF